MVNLDGIKGKIFLTLLLPIWVGLLFMIVASYLPIRYVCDYLIDDIYSEFISRNNRIGDSIQKARVEYINTIKNTEVDLLLLVNVTLGDFFNNKPIFKSDFNPESVSYNGVHVLFNIAHPQNWKSSCDCSYSSAEWYISPNENSYNEISEQAKYDIQLAASMHSVLRPFNTWVDFMSGYIWIFEESGVYYTSPARNSTFFGNYTEDENCKYDRTYFQPRCKMWHLRTQKSSTEIVLNHPYFVNEFGFMNEFICLKILKNSTFYASLCLQPKINYLKMNKLNPVNDCWFKVYVTRPDGAVISQPELWRSDYTPGILDLEFGKDSSKERTFFEKAYLPKLNQTEKGNGIYATKSSTNVIYHNPSMIVLNKLPNFPHYFYGSITYSVDIKDILSDTQDLNSLVISRMNYEGFVWTAVLVLTLIIYWIITLRLINIIIKPLEDLIFKTQELNSGNYDIKFKENQIETCKEVFDLYDVFEMLKFGLVLDETKYFEDEEEAMENYITGHYMFKKFNNHSGAEICLFHIALLYMKKSKFEEAEKKLNKISSDNRKCGYRLMAKKYLAICYFENEKIAEGKSLINALCNEYERGGNWAGWVENALIECEYCSKYDFPTEQILDIIQHLLKNTEGNDILYQKYYYCRGLDYLNQSKHKQALKFLHKSLFKPESFDYLIKKKTLSKVNFILELYNIKFEWSFNYLWSLEDRRFSILIFHTEDRLSQEYALVLKSQFSPYLTFPDDLSMYSIKDKLEIQSTIHNYFLRTDSKFSKTSTSSMLSLKNSVESSSTDHGRNIWMVMISHNEFKIGNFPELLESIYRNRINVILITKNYDTDNEAIREVATRFLAFNAYETHSEEMLHYIFCQRKLKGKLASCISY